MGDYRVNQKLSELCDNMGDVSGLVLCHFEASNEMADDADELIGVWKSDERDVAELRPYGNTTLEFEADGTLRYTVHENGKDQIMLLTFRVEPGFIVTNQPSHPRSEKTAYEFTRDGRLVLNFGGQKSVYCREKEAGDNRRGTGAHVDGNRVNQELARRSSLP